MNTFSYGDVEISHLRKKDLILAVAIDKIGHVNRAVNADLFSSVVHSIVGQQISTTAQETVWQRLNEKLGEVKPQTVCALSAAELKSCGMSFRKAEYIQSFAQKVLSGDFDINRPCTKKDKSKKGVVTKK